MRLPALIKVHAIPLLVQLSHALKKPLIGTRASAILSALCNCRWHLSRCPDSCTHITIS